MSRIRAAFQNNKAFIAFITGGDPDLETTEKLVPQMAAAGADIIEIGIPFSDPVAEGPVIQAASERALKAGCTIDKLFQTVARIRQQTQVPLLFMTYLNPVFTYGKDKFFERCQDCGIDGIIVPDMPFEEKGELAGTCEKYGVDLISLIAPTSEERIHMIAKEAQGFLYCVSSLGVTGMRERIETDLAAMIKKAKAVSDIPCAVGFGISTPKQAADIAAIADGVIVGSAIVNLITQYGRDCLEPVCQYVQEMKNSIMPLR
ncbi:MAG: tryptophan synthase subunit alpha [Firmicutes bacterium]|nr:tryptophan synthase subunit alpha [Bacillota bacterium]